MSLRKIKLLANIFIAVLLVFFTACTSLAAIALNSSVFPDPGLLAYLAYGPANTMYGGNDRNILEDCEIPAVTRLSDFMIDIGIPFGVSIKSFKGIEHLTGLKRIGSTYNNVTDTVLDLTHNGVLEDLYYYHNQYIRTIIVGASKNELTITLEDCPELTTLNISGATSLTELTCTCKNLKELIPKSPVLTKLICTKAFQHYGIKKLDVTACTALNVLDCSRNELTEIDLRNNHALTELGIAGNKIKTLDLSSNPLLKYLYCDNNELTELDLSRHDNLVKADVGMQTREGLNVKITGRGFEVDFNDYVSDVSRIVPTSIRGSIETFNEENKGRGSYGINLSLYDESTGIAVFEEYPTQVTYNYDTGHGEMVVMIYNYDSSVQLFGGRYESSLGSGILDIDENNYYAYIYRDGAKTLTALTEDNMKSSELRGSVVGFAADGNSRILLKARANKPGYVAFSIDDDIGAKIETISGRSEANHVRTQNGGDNDYYAYAMLVAPDSFPGSFTEDHKLFTVHVKFVADDGTTAENDKKFMVEPAPVILLSGFFDDTEKTFGKGTQGSIYSKLSNIFHVYCANCSDIWSIVDIVKGDVNFISSKLQQEVFPQYRQREIVCTRADIVAFGIGGLIASKFLQKEKQDLPLSLSSTQTYNVNEGNNWSSVSYGQGMIRSLITVATPFYGTPWADIMKDIKKFPYIWNIADLGNNIGIFNSINTLNLPFLALNLMLKQNLQKISTLFRDKNKILEELAATSEFNYKIPDTIPTFSICGNIGGVGEVIKGIALETGVSVGKHSKDVILFLAGNFFTSKSSKYMEIAKFSPFSIGAVSIASTASTLITVFQEVPKLTQEIIDAETLLALYMVNLVFGGEENDLIVSCKSAIGNSDYFRTFTGWRYRHDTICKQPDVARAVIDYLERPLRTSRSAKSEAVPMNAEADIIRTSKAVASTKSSSGKPSDFDTKEFQFIEAMKLNVFHPLVKISDNGTQSVKFSVTAKKNTSYDVYCRVYDDTRSTIFKIPRTDDKGKTFEVNVIFDSEDMGLLKAVCFSYNPNDKEGTSVLVSNTVNIASALTQNIQKSDIAYVRFLNTSIYTNVKAETPAGLYAVGNDGKVYALSGVKWRIDDSEIASIDDNGIIHGLKEGSTTLHAEYQDFYISSAYIYVRPEIKAPEIEFTFPTRNFDYPNAIVNGGTAPYVWEISDGALPEGTNLSPVWYSGKTGGKVEIRGKPSAVGKYKFTLKVTDDNGDSAEKVITWNITAPVIKGSVKNGIINASYSAKLTIEGGKTPYSRYSYWSGVYPEGLKLFISPDNIVNVEGTPTKAGSFTFHVNVTDYYGFDDKKSFTIKITSPAISGALKTSGAVDKSYSSAITVSGGTAPYTWTKASGTLPGGLKLKPNDNGTTLTLAGTPNKAGTFTFTLKTADKNKANISKKFTIKILPKVTTSASMPTKGTVGTKYTGTLTASGGTSYTWKLASGTLPTGLKLSNTSKPSARLSGTPTEAGKFTFTLKAADESGATASKKFTVTIAEKPIVSGDLTAKGVIKKSYSSTVNIKGGTSPYEWTINSGTLPAGLTLNPNSTGAKLTIKGTPTTAKAYTFTLKATDKNGATASKKFTVTITKPVISGDITSKGVIKKSYSSAITISGGTSPYVWTHTGTLPAGLTLNPNSTGTKLTLKGTPTTAKTYTFTLKATDKNGATASKKFTVTITKPSISGTLTASGTVKSSYSSSISVSKGTSPYKWAKSKGTLPAGLKMSTNSTGTKLYLKGTPTTAKAYTFTLKATDKNGATTSKKFTVTIVKATTNKSGASIDNISKNTKDISRNTSSIQNIVIPDSQETGSIYTQKGFTELKVSNDILWQGEGKDEDLIGVQANEPLTFIIENAPSDMQVIIDDKATEGIEISDEGNFTLPSEFVSDDFKIRAENDALETNEILISVEK